MVRGAFAGLAVAGFVAMGSSPVAAAQSAGDDVGSIVEAARVAFDVPGAAVVVVRDGEVVALEGFGVSDRSGGAPVDPERTVFRIGSVSKPITALAAHLLAGQGELDLDADVAELTGVDLPGDSPVTVQSLLTHTAGFEDRAIGIYTWDVDEVDPLSVYVPANVPARFAPTGVVHSYSNYGYALAGYALESATGQGFPELLGGRVLGPLGMTRTTFAQSPPPGLAVGYTGTPGARAPADPFGVRPYPAAGAFTTAADMGSLLLALLGRAPDVVPGEVLDAYLGPGYRANPDVPGRTGGGLVERRVDGVRIVGHGGDVGAYSAELVLVPEQHLGFFLAANAVDHEFSHAVVDGLLDLLVDPAPVAEPEFADLAEDELAEYAGAYRWTRYSRTQVDKVLAMTPPYNTFVRAPGDGTLVVTWLGVDEQWVYRPVAGGSLVKVSGDSAVVDGLVIDPGERIAFTRAADGKVAYLNLSMQTVAAQKVPLPLVGVVQVSTIGVIVLLFLLALPGWGLGAWLRSRRPDRPVRPGERRLRRFLVAQTALVVGALVLLFAGVGGGAAFGMPPAAIAAAVAFTAAAVAGLALPPAAVVAWARGLLTVGERAQLTVLALAAPVLLWWTLYWNLFGLRF